MKKIRTIFVLVITSVVFSLSIFAQATGDYKTKSSGKWSDAAIWQKYNGTSWVAATSAPTGTETITIEATDSVDCNTAVIIKGTMKSLGGRFGNSQSTLTFDNGSTFEMAADGGYIPLANWASGSTVLFTGTVAKAPENSNQNFYNVTWNCPGYTTAVNLGWFNNTIGGNVRVINSNKIALRFTSNTASPDGLNTITINGNVTVDDLNGYLTATGSSGTDTIAVFVKGNVTSGGTLNLANGSGAMCNWYVAGNIDIKGGTFTTNSTTTRADSIVFNGTVKQTFVKTGDITSLANVRFGVRKGAIVDLDTNTIGTSTNTGFALEKGATVITRHAIGLKGNLTGALGATLSTEASYVYEGKIAQTDSLLPGTVNNLTFNNPGGFTLTRPVKVNGVLKIQSGTVDNLTHPITIGTGGSVVYAGGKTTAQIPGWPTAVEEGKVKPQRFALEQNFPNPFNPATTISFFLDKSTKAKLTIYNMAGQEVVTLINGNLTAGQHVVSFDASNVTSGIYLYTLTTPTQSVTRKMSLIK